MDKICPIDEKYKLLSYQKTATGDTPEYFERQQSVQNS